MFKNLLCFVSLLVISTYVQALESGICMPQPSSNIALRTLEPVMCSYVALMAKVLLIFYLCGQYLTFAKVQATEGRDIFTVSPIVQDDKFLLFAHNNGHPGDDIVMIPGVPDYPALQWRISGPDEDGFWTENRRFRYIHIGQDFCNQRIVAQAADRESPNQLGCFVLVNWAIAKHQDSIEVSPSLKPGYYHIKPLIEDNLALVAGIDKKGRGWLWALVE
ncbi:hypothetical protein IW261DRAFT_1423159 [Armillaria novae-zelandiae]|uniref:Ricin B lectin domain-containing protein n=1 Tax=Armillaria novae-zelandiae TaxID=153914 RepID=A0AA39NYK8_9AGAR|nr:hypothetical protein IW261DRAFT_1423159 [Armillaria novae-zelandiae]